MNTRKILALATLVTVVLLSSCKKDDYVPIKGVCPKVVSTNPPDQATGVPSNQIVTATFNEDMNPKTITETSFTLHGSIVPGTVTYSDSTAIFTPTDPLIPNHLYTGRIATTVKDMMGNALQEEYVWTFNTDSVVMPHVIATNPLSNEANVVLSKSPTATFDMAMDAASITAASFIVKQGNNPIAGVVTYAGVTATFNPTNDLIIGLTYTATITAAAKNTAGKNLDKDYTWSFSTGALVDPIVISTDPLNSATSVSLSKTLSATFSMPMNAATLNASTFTLKQGANSITGTVSYAGTKASFNPNSSLLPGVLYTATITTGASNVAGTALANNYVWTFTTAVLTPPTVISVNPLNNATGVALNKTLTATFDMGMDASTINASTFTLKNGNTTKVGTISYNGTTASFNPTTNLLPNTLYTATITTGAKNPAGSGLASNYVWTFTTAATATTPSVISTDPLDIATGVALNKSVAATFNMAMDAATINGTTYTVKQGTTSIAGAISYTGNIATFNPTNDFLPGLVYTATLTTGVKNPSGTALASNYVWTFTTLSGTGPIVNSTDPLNNASGVALNKTLTATFNMAMDALTLDNNTFLLEEGTNTITGVVTYSGNTASFNPNANLQSGKTYTATITTGAKNVGGTALASDYVWTFSTVAQAGPIAPNLGSAEDFGILAATTVTNNAGVSQIINMDVGVYPGTAVTGFPPGLVINGVILTSTSPSPAPATLLAAKTALTAAYLFAESASSPAPVTVSGNIGGTTLAPGIYKSTSTLSVDGTSLTLDAGGDANAVWIFQVSSTFITTTGGSIVLAGGAQAKNVYWQVGSSATIGDNTAFNGNILALVSITMNTNATAVGHMLTQTGAVVLTSTNIITKP